MIKYIRCRNCGKYIAWRRETIDGYCSDACREKYICCATCGKYFPEKEQYKKTGKCSRKCNIKYKVGIA